MPRFLSAGLEMENVVGGVSTCYFYELGILREVDGGASFALAVSRMLCVDECGDPDLLEVRIFIMLQFLGEFRGLIHSHMPV